MSTLKSDFLTKSKQMSTWIPVNSVSNRDRLELYSLHKQAANGDCDVPMPTTAGNSGDLGKEKAKWNAWKSKSGLSRAESMQRYITECDRQVRIYGSKGQPIPPSNESSLSTTNSTSNTLTTDDDDDDSKIHTNGSSVPGINAIPIFAAQASEPLDIYLQRMAITNTSSPTFWGLQTPVCAPPGVSYDSALHPNNVIKMLETMMITAGRTIEDFSLKRIIPLVPPSTIQAFFYPLNVSLLSLYITFIFVVSTSATSVQVLKTVLLGSKATNATLPDLVNYSIIPTSRLSTSLSSSQHSIPIRILSLLLLPLPLTSDILQSTNKHFGPLFSTGVWLALIGLTWWYWIIVLPWLAIFPNFFCSVGLGVCCGLIEFAGK